MQCDKCNLWQHQVCALFNGRRNEGGEAEYTCPQCLAAEMERGERKPLPPSAVLGAKDMPKTLLSDHLESRLARKLDAERQQRAALAGRSKEEVRCFACDCPPLLVKIACNGVWFNYGSDGLYAVFDRLCVFLSSLLNLNFFWGCAWLFSAELLITHDCNFFAFSLSELYRFRGQKP